MPSPRCLVRLTRTPTCGPGTARGFSPGCCVVAQACFASWDASPLASRRQTSRLGGPPEAHVRGLSVEPAGLCPALRGDLGPYPPLTLLMVLTCEPGCWGRPGGLSQGGLGMARLLGGAQQTAGQPGRGVAGILRMPGCPRSLWSRSTWGPGVSLLSRLTCPLLSQGLGGSPVHLVCATWCLLRSWLVLAHLQQAPALAQVQVPYAQ